MTHILCNTKEFELMSKIKLPNGTSLIEQSEDGDCLRQYRVIDGEWKLEVDLEEKRRPFTKQEAEVFKKSITKDKILDFFINHSDSNNTPQREYSAMSDAEWDLFKYIRHAGSYIPGNPNINLFRIWISKNSDLDEAEKEIIHVLDKIKQKIPQWNPIIIGIMEHSLSANGSYDIAWDTKNNFEIRHRWRDPVKFTSLKSLLQYIQNNLYYE